LLKVTHGEIVELPKPWRWAKKVVQGDSEVQEVKLSRRSSARPGTTRLCKTAKVEASEDEGSNAIIVVSDDDEEVKAKSEVIHEVPLYPTSQNY